MVSSVRPVARAYLPDNVNEGTHLELDSSPLLALNNKDLSSRVDVLGWMLGCDGQVEIGARVQDQSRRLQIPDQRRLGGRGRRRARG